MIFNSRCQQANQHCYKYNIMSEIDLSGFTEINERFSYNRFECLGQGQFGKVYIGWDASQKRKIAVKHISNSILKKTKGLQLRELQILQKVKHEYLMEYYGSKRLPTDGLYLFLELCQRGSLSTFLNKEKLSQAQAMNLFKQLIQGMAYLNTNGIFHRDLKPDNLLLTFNNKLKIADFGTARDISGSQDIVATFKKGTPIYAAPEVYLLQEYESIKGKYNHTCDVYSAGYILYEMMTGQQLTKNITTQLQLKNFLRNNKKNGLTIEHPALKPRWIKLLRQMLSFDPVNRPSFKDVMNEIEGFLPPSTGPRIQRPRGEQQKLFSTKMLNEFQEYLTKQERKNNISIIILRGFYLYQNQNSQIIPRVYKLLILFFGLSKYCLLSQQGLAFLHKPENIEIGKFTIQSLGDRLLASDKKQLFELIEKMADRVNKGNQQIRSFMLQQIVPQLQIILNEEKESPEKSVVQEYLNLDSLTAFKQEEYKLNIQYSNYFKKCVNNLFVTRAELETLSDTDIKLYLMLLTLLKYAKIQQTFEFLQHQCLNVQQLKNMGRVQVLKQINQLKQELYNPK